MPETLPSPSTTVTVRISPTVSTNWRDAWGYWLPVVVFVVIWNLALVVSVICTLRENQTIPLFVWFGCRSLLRSIHVLLLLLEYNIRRRNIIYPPTLISTGIRFLKRLEKLTTELFDNRWIISCIWMLCGGEILRRDAINLFWLFRIILATDNLFCVFCHEFCLSFPIINQDDISIIPKYRFNGRACRMIPAITNGPNFSVLRLLHAEDAECCICLCKYEDGEKLNSLPCKHHFHAVCLLKWLTVKATCPLCNRKYIIC